MKGYKNNPHIKMRFEFDAILNESELMKISDLITDAIIRMWQEKAQNHLHPDDYEKNKDSHKGLAIIETSDIEPYRCFIELNTT